MLLVLALTSALLVPDGQEKEAAKDAVLANARALRQCLLSHALLFAQHSDETASVVASMAVRKCGDMIGPASGAESRLSLAKSLQERIENHVFEWRVKADIEGDAAYRGIATQLDIKPLIEFELTR